MPKRNAKRAAHRTVRRSDGDVHPLAEEADSDAENGTAADEPANLFAALRSGAANVAGVTFQISVTGWLLASARASPGSETDVVSVMPEGFEDIDCQVRSGRKLLVQTKERGIGARAIGIAELAKIIDHAAPALTADLSAHFAVLTNGRFGNALPTTGFSSTLADALVAAPMAETRTSLVEALTRVLADRGVALVNAQALLARTHLIALDIDLAETTLTLLQTGMNLHRAVASLVRAELLRDLGDVASRHREATLATAEVRSLTDLHVLATRILQAVDVPSLDEAVTAGICEPADYLSAPSVDVAGFYAGVDVIPAHVAAGFDVVRLEETTAVIEGLVAHGDVVIAGPSGSGKSALIWRCAHLVRTGARVLRVHRVLDHDDVEVLVRHVRRQLPNGGARVLVVADDLGRDRMAAWPDARRRLVEIPGVLVLAAVRREDLTPGMSANAVVVDPKLTDSAARSVYSAMEAAGMETAMAADEAVTRAEGLLMEFIALVTTGRRLRDVLAVQVDALRGDRVRREALRIVCAAHLLGSAVPADALPAALGVAPDVAGDALTRLAGEHLVIAEGRLWHGLHDLRAETLFALLHTSPPPTLAVTYATAFPLLPAAAQGPAVRRAAVRVARHVAELAVSATPGSRLAAISEALEPIAAGLRDALAAVADGRWSVETTAHAASLVEAADRLDTIAYVHAVLPFLDRERPPTADLATLATLAYSAAVGGLTFDGPLQAIGSLGRRLPPRTSRCADVVATALTPTVLYGLATAAPSVEARIRFCEAADAVGASLVRSDAAEVYKTVVARLPDPPGSGGSRLDADRRARLTATLTALAMVRGPDVAASFGPAEARVEDAVASDEYSCEVQLRFEPHLPASSELARRNTYSANEMLVADVRMFARADAPPEPTAYPLQPGSTGESVNDQAVLMARRLFDACPDVDHVNIEVWKPNREPAEPDGVKALRAGVVPRPASFARSVAFQAGVAEALGADNWTRRLRDQASVARDLAVLLGELPRRLERRDNSGRRRSWVDRAKAAARAVAALPGRPADRPPIRRSADHDAFERTAAMVDEELRRPDRARSALEMLAGAILQVADNLEDRRLASHAGHRLAEVPPQLREARGDGTPVFSGIGEALPLELEHLAAFASRLLTALDVDTVSVALDHAKGDRAYLERALDDAANRAASKDAQVVASFLLSHGVPSVTHIATDRRPIPVWRKLQAVLVCDLADWPTIVSALQAWSAEDRSVAGLTGRAVVVAAEDDELLPLGLGLFGSGDVLPVSEDAIPEIAAVISARVRDQRFRQSIAVAGEELVAYSYEQVRRDHRDPNWAIPPSRALTPSQTEIALRRDFASLLEAADRDDLDQNEAYGAAAVALMLQLCARVADEDPSDGLAAQLASIDIRALREPDPDSSAALLNAAQVAALEADRRPRS